MNVFDLSKLSAKNPKYRKNISSTNKRWFRLNVKLSKEANLKRKLSTISASTKESEIEPRSKKTCKNRKKMKEVSTDSMPSDKQGSKPGWEHLSLWSRRIRLDGTKSTDQMSSIVVECKDNTRPNKKRIVFGVECSGSRWKRFSKTRSTRKKGLSQWTI